MEEWFIRFLMGFPPRAESDDKINFFRTFPEVKSHDNFGNYFNELDFLYLTRRRIYTKEFIESWLLDKKINNDYKKCYKDNCPYKNNELNENFSQENEDDLYRLMSNFDNNVNNEGMNDKIIKKIQEIISNNHQEKKLILKGISIVDPYLFLNISNNKDKGHENAKKFIDEIIKKFNSVKIKIYSDESRKNNGKTVDIDKVKKFFKDKSNINLYNSNNWHDRPIVLHFEKESKPEYFGILIGSSIGSIEGTKIYFVCDINDVE